jgi:hypothetical protein
MIAHLRKALEMRIELLSRNDSPWSSQLSRIWRMTVKGTLNRKRAPQSFHECTATADSHPL